MIYTYAYKCIKNDDTIIQVNITSKFNEIEKILLFNVCSVLHKETCFLMQENCEKKNTQNTNLNKLYSTCTLKKNTKWLQKQH